jgi:tRNA (mo5U34)-methyltransferase
MPFEQLFDYKIPHDRSKVTEIRAPRLQQLTNNQFATFRSSLEALPVVKTKHLVVNQPIIEIGHHDELSTKQHQDLLQALQVFIPWKKGPFKIFGHLIDAEWRSDLKWDRIEPNISTLTGKTIADIGCNNGYFMLRMLAQRPNCVIGFEPYAKHLFTFALLTHFIDQPELFFDLLGMEHLDLFSEAFDTIFCLGILYHHTDPVGLLRKLFSALKPGGEAIIECQGILGDESYALVPAGRYAQARGIWNLPTATCLENWLKRTNFQNVEVFSCQLLSTNEQRATSWAPIKSLVDFLDPNDPSRTIEGYPAPARIYVKAMR